MSRYLGIALFLAVMLPVTWLAKQGALVQLQARIEDEKARALEGVLNTVQARFHQLQHDLLDAAEQIRDQPVVTLALEASARTSSLQDVKDEQDQAIRLFDTFDLPDRTAAELYTARGELMAWKGFSIPLVDSSRFSTTAIQTGIVSDVYREALALWVPISIDQKVLGAVRMVRLLEVRVPVQTQYLRNYDIAYRWRKETRASFSVQFGSVDTSSVFDHVEAVQILRGIDGTPLGFVAVPIPNLEVLARARSVRFDDVLAFWSLLLAGWLLAGLWMGYRHCLRIRSKWTGLVFIPCVLAWVGLRYGLLNWDIPVRWFEDQPVTVYLFDPIYLSASFGGGVARTVGDLLLTVLFGLGIAGATVDLVAHYARQQLRTDGEGWAVFKRHIREPNTTASPVRFFGILIGLLVLQWLLFTTYGMLVRQTILDSSLDYFAWTGLMPELPVATVFATLLLGMAAVILVGMALYWLGGMYLRRYRPSMWSGWSLRSGIVLSIILIIAVLYSTSNIAQWVPWWTGLGFVVIGAVGAVYILVFRLEQQRVFGIRSLLLSLLVATGLLYPLVYQSMDAQRRVHIRQVADEFAAVSNTEIQRLIGWTLTELRAQPTIYSVFDPSTQRFDPDLIPKPAPNFFQGGYRVHVTLFDSAGQRLWSNAEGRDHMYTDSLAFVRLYRAYHNLDAEEPVALIHPIAGEGIALIPDRNNEGRLGWALVQVHQGPAFSETLALAGYEGWRSGLSVAEYRRGLLVRSEGTDIERLRLSDFIAGRLKAQREIWYEETIHDRTFRTYYRRHDVAVQYDQPVGIFAPHQGSVIAARARAVIPYDHLYYLLRIIVAGLWVALPMYFLFVLIRSKAGWIQPRRVYFSDRVQNAFLVVGVTSVVLMGFLGQKVVERENVGAIESRLHRRLQRVESALTLRARDGEQLFQVLDRTSIQDLSTDLSLDLNVYQGAALIASSQVPSETQLLIEPRLPVEAYKELYLLGFQQAFVETETRPGLYPYTIGYKTLPDVQGVPQRVIAVLTIPEQERIREERARTTAYLFGSLLLLLLIVMGTATVLANALSQPMRRLRDGLEAVAEGRFQQPLEVTSEDEFGELVRTFNGMQTQLAESRLKLAQQERELAWREMARQVAHEIKNPLTPMKLSIQHLQRSYGDGDVLNRPEEVSRFNKLFQRITQTLTEQIDTLARIANEFSTFARLPNRNMESLDLNEIIEEAAALFQEEEQIRVHIEVAPEPLIIDADHGELRRLYINLLKNGIQAMPGGGDLTIRAQRLSSENGLPGWAYSEVIDTGSGIPVDIQPKIFQPNFSTKTSGMGLGLAIVKKSVEAMKGEIGFDTREQEGTTFWMKFPLVER